MTMIYKKIVALVLIFFGAATLVAVSGPIIWQQADYFLSPKMIDPTRISGQPIVLTADLFSNNLDYTDTSNWFPRDTPRPVTASQVKYYSLSIPAVGILDVPVEINGSDLKKNAVHYTGTSLPGNWGNAVVFGHSTLPQLYRSGDPVSVFNWLPKIRVGDEVVVKYDGIIYRYRVRETLEVLPTQIEVLAQRYDRHEITLITCVPLGTYLRRFVARAELVN